MEKALVRCEIVIAIVTAMVHGNDRKVVVKATTSRNGCLALVRLGIVVKSASPVDHESVETAELRRRVRVANRE